MKNKNYILILIILLVAQFSKAHNSYETFFNVSTKENTIHVIADFPWKIRNALFEFNPSLKLSKNQSDYNQVLFNYINSNIRIFDKNNEVVQLLKVENISSTEHNHGTKFILVFDGASIGKIENSLLFNINENQSNYHIVNSQGKKFSFKTTSKKPVSNLLLMNQSNSTFNQLLIALFFVFICVIIYKRNDKFRIFRRELLASFFVILLLISCTEEQIIEETVALNEESFSAPNILLIIADDMGLDVTPGYTEGIIKPKMNNLEQLISTGIRFNNFWSAPTCTPTRSTILTGKYGIETKVLAVGDQLSSNETALQEQMEGYATALIGKWHLSNDPLQAQGMGIDYFAGLMQGGVQSYWNWELSENGSSIPITEYATTKFTDLAIDWVNNQDKPWFLWLAYNAPHAPFHLPPEGLHSQGNLPTDATSINTNPLPYYLAALEAMDSEIGRLLSTLPEEERANTVVLFIGDNGTPNEVIQEPYQSNRAKGSLHQGGVNVPLIVSGDLVQRNGAVENALINSTDLFATILDLSNSGSLAPDNSISFEPLLSATVTHERTNCYAEIQGGNSEGYTIRNEAYKLIVLSNGNERFYNLLTDPYEKINLINRGLSEGELFQKEQLEAELAKIRT